MTSGPPVLRQCRAGWLHLFRSVYAQNGESIPEHDLHAPDEGQARSRQTFILCDDPVVVIEEVERPRQVVQVVSKPVRFMRQGARFDHFRELQEAFDQRHFLGRC